MAKWFWHAIVIITAVGNWAAVGSAANADDPAVFRWMDEQGTIIFTDDPTTMPRSDKQAKKREPVKAESRQVQLDLDNSPIKKEAKQEREMAGGHSEGRRRQKINPDTAIGAGTAHQKQLNSNYYIQVSISQCKLTIFKKGAQAPMVPVKTYKVGTVVKGLGVYPVGKGKITRIDLSPYWYPTGHTRKIYEQKGIELPKAVPPGHPLNYMGTFKIHLSHATSQGSIYRIHGNNNKKRVGKRVTGGCICMDNADGVELAKIVPVGTEVDIVL